MEPQQYHLNVTLQYPGPVWDRRPIALVRQGPDIKPWPLYVGDSACFTVHTADGKQARVWLATVDPERWRWPPVVRRWYYRLRRIGRNLWPSPTAS